MIRWSIPPETLVPFTTHAGSGLGDNDIQIGILYAGICHSDLHHVFGDWGKEEYVLDGK